MDVQSNKPCSTRTAPKQKKYCCVTSCENFKGAESDIRVFSYTCIINFPRKYSQTKKTEYTPNEYFHFRFPKNIAMNEQWKESLGITSDKLASGTICINHFIDTDFKRKDKHHVTLNPDAIPTIAIASHPSLPEQQVENIDFVKVIERDIQFQDQPSEISECNLCGEIELQTMGMKLEHNIEIQRYQQKIGEMESKIKNMRKQLTKVNKNAYYLQTMKKKLVQKQWCFSWFYRQYA